MRIHFRPGVRKWLERQSEACTCLHWGTAAGRLAYTRQILAIHSSDRLLASVEGTRPDPDKVIYTAWHRLGIYLRVVWRTLVKKIKSGKLRYGEAELAMRAQFGSNPAVWNIHELTLDVPPVPPRPP